MDRMTTSDTISGLSVRGYLKRLRANWPALLLPLVAAGTLGLFGPPWPLLLVLAAVLITLLAPAESARIVPFALLAYGAYGPFLLRALLIREKAPVLYGLVHASRGTYPRWHTSGPLGLVLTEAVAFMAAGVCLLARPEAPGGGAVRRAVAQLRGTGGQPRTVPPLLLFPVLFLWEEFLFDKVWFSWNVGPRVLAVLIFVVAVAAFRWLPRVAVTLAVVGTMLFGLEGVLAGVNWLRHGEYGLARVPAALISFYGAVPLDGGITALFAGVQGAVLLGVGCLLVPRLLTWGADAELAERARALAQRVEGLTRSRTDATETAVAELRRIERDLHDGAQARLVAVGMSLRAAEQLMPANPEAALALVVEARETSSRAIDDLRDLVRGIYPPVLADRGLADAVRALALDAVLEVDVDVDLPGEPPMPVAAAVYFAVAEALTNAARHAGACAVRLSMEHVAGMLRATITDDGHGGADAELGTGLAGVERRLATFDGILAVSSPAGGPTIVAIEVPCALSSVKISSC
jgi:signal transduction histidine kinase